MVDFRNPNLFEKILLVFGVFVIIISYVALHRMVVSGADSVDALQVIFLWLILLVMIIMTSVNENMKEELKIVIRNQHEEIKLLRQDLTKRRK